MMFRPFSTMKPAMRVVFFLLMTILPAFAATGAPGPEQVIEATSAKVQEALRKEKFPIDFTRANRIVRDILDPQVDLNRAALLILGKHWRTATPKQRERFKSEFRTLLIRTYTTAFTQYKEWTIRFLPVQTDPEDKNVMIRTEIIQEGAKPVAVNYRMAQDGNAWKAYDVMIEGISLVQNYRTTFSDEVARTGSLDAVIDTLARRNAEALKEGSRNRDSSL